MTRLNQHLARNSTLLVLDAKVTGQHMITEGHRPYSLELKERMHLPEDNYCLIRQVQSPMGSRNACLIKSPTLYRLADLSRRIQYNIGGRGPRKKNMHKNTSRVTLTLRCSPGRSPPTRMPTGHDTPELLPPTPSLRSR